MYKHNLAKPEANQPKLNVIKVFGKYALPAVGGIAIGAGLFTSALFIFPQEKVISVRDAVRAAFNLPKTDLRQYAANDVPPGAAVDVLPTQVESGPGLLRVLKNEVHVYSLEKIANGTYVARVAFKDSRGEFKSLDMKLGDISVASFDGKKLAVIFAQVIANGASDFVPVFKTFSERALLQ